MCGCTAALCSLARPPSKLLGKPPCGAHSLVHTPHHTAAEIPADPPKLECHASGLLSQCLSEISADRPSRPQTNTRQLFGFPFASTAMRGARRNCVTPADKRMTGPEPPRGQQKHKTQHAPKGTPAESVLLVPPAKS